MQTWPPAIAKNAKLASAAFAIPVGLYSATL